jgi:hypothetical protein
VVGDELVDVFGHLDPGGREDHDEVAEALEVGQDVGGEHDCGFFCYDHVHQGREEAMTSQWVESRDGLVEEEEFGVLRETQGKGYLGLLTPRQTSRLAVERDP